MTASWPAMTGRPRAWSAPLRPAAGVAMGLVVLTCASMAAVAAIAVVGLWALLFPLYAALVVETARAPGRTAAALVFLAIAFEPNAIDVTGPIGRGLWIGPAGVESLPVGPMEVLLVAVTASLWWRRRPSNQPSLPAVAWLIPAFIALGLLYGYKRGAPPNLAYHEARGLLFAVVAFLACRLMTREDRVLAARAALLGSLVMSVVLIARYVFIVAPGKSDVPVEFAFRHEGPVILALGFVGAAVFFVRGGNAGRRVALLAYMLLVLAAILVTGRRAATLALLVGGLVAFWQMVPRKPALVIALLVPVMTVGVAYLGVFWHREYGAFAQPARAIRSQIDPNARDYSSDRYREIELENVLATLDLNPVFGVGFGNPFAGFQQLPDLTDIWPLQMHVAHQNLLWLWLKTGFLGITAFVTLWVIAVSRCLRAIRGSPGFAAAPVIVVAGLFVCLAYTVVDTALAETRSAAFFAVLVAAALSFSTERREDT